ncbi:MAG: MerR family DNA-binding transcriptional regulator [Pseudomonadota bacterium]
MMNQLADAQAAFGSDEEFSIRDLCDAFDVTPRALRFYESQELIMPRRDGQRRIYTLRDRARLKLILRGKRFGFSLAEIRELLNLYDLGDGQVTQLSLTLETALGKLDELKERREEITAVIGDLENQIGLVRNMLRERGESQVS